MDWTIIATVIAALGGFEFIKWFVNRKAYARKENASAKEAEDSLHEKQLQRYEDRLKQRDAKVDAIYKELREEQAEKLELIKENNSLQLKIELLSFQKCEVRGCSDRRPPSMY